MWRRCKCVCCSAAYIQLEYWNLIFGTIGLSLIILCLIWHVRVLGKCSDSVQDTIKILVGVFACLKNVMNGEWQLILVWCEAYQLDVIIEHVTNSIVKECFFSTKTGCITHLTQQQVFIHNMNTTCHRLVNHCLSTEKVITCFKLYRSEMLAHIN